MWRGCDNYLGIISVFYGKIFLLVKKILFSKVCSLKNSNYSELSTYTLF